MTLSVVILGSGGPIANARRASSGYLVNIDGVARVLVDAGGGVYERLGRLGADLSGLELVLLTHTHIDHSGGLAPVLFNAYMRDRGRPIAIAGPQGREQHPGCRRFTDLLFGKDGAWSYLHTFDGFGIEASEVPSNPDASTSVTSLGVTGGLRGIGVSISSVPVRHGMMPAVAYRISAGDASITFSGDVSEASSALASLAQETSLLVHDFALPERDVPHGNLHAKPSAVGRVAQQARARALLVSHFMPPIEDELDPALALVRSEYHGPVYVANDLDRYSVSGDGAALDKLT